MIQPTTLQAFFALCLHICIEAQRRHDATAQPMAPYRKTTSPPSAYHTNQPSTVRPRSDASERRRSGVRTLSVRRSGLWAPLPLPVRPSPMPTLTDTRRLPFAKLVHPPSSSAATGGWLEMAAAAFPRLCALLLPFLALASCIDVPSHGCYWTGCQSKWFGVCSDGHFLDSHSNDCCGLCTESKSPPCLPLHTHFYCCIPGTPRVTNKCGHCKNKLDFGKEFICCSDCSDPTIMFKESKLGYCKSGAELTMQLKPHETFHWVAGPWMECSSPCDGGVRYRDVACYGSLDDTTIRHYPVDDASCSANEMPARQEACNQQSCSDLEMIQPIISKRSGMTAWLMSLVVVLGIVAIGGIAFTSYTYYMRKTSVPSAFVYVMMEAYP